MKIEERLQVVGMLKEVSTKTLVSGDKVSRMIFEIEGAEVILASQFAQLQAGARCKIEYDPDINTD